MFLVSAAVWALLDDRAGHNAHTLGIAKALGIEYETRELRFRSFLSKCRPPGLLSLTRASQAVLSPPWPAIVIASGRRMIPIIQHIRRQSAHTRTIQCLWPGHTDGLDLICAPEHDILPPSDKILRFKGALHPLDEASLRDASLTFQALFDDLPKPHIGVLIGGHTHNQPASLANLYHLIDTAELLAGEGSLIITTSRRTPKTFCEAIESRLTCRYHLHRYDSPTPNPYRAMLALCDQLIVSGDSVSMVSEACYSGKPVLVDQTFDSMRPKHHRAMQGLIQDGYARPLSANIQPEQLSAKRLDERSRLAQLIRERLNV